MSPLKIRREMNAWLKAALRRTRRSQVFLELYSGTGPVAKQIRQLSGYEVLEVDIKDHPMLDLTNGAVVRVLEGWCRSRVVRGVWISFPCATWSLARRPPLRSLAELTGRRAVLSDPKSRQQLRVGNATFAAACRIAEL